jgi:general secretion pathway protein E
MQAAITGHLVFSTIHTRDTTGTIFRLLDLNVEPYLVAQALHIVLAQRLVRQLCAFCKAPVAITSTQIERMGPAAQGIKKLYVPQGCVKCLGTGFAGRRAFFELLGTTDQMRDLIARAPTLGQIQSALAGTQFQSLQHSGYQLVAQGMAPFEEIDRAIGRDQRAEQ